MQTDSINFTQRAQRTGYIFEKFKQYLGRSILDVGCDQAVLKTLLDGDHQYTGIDVAGSPDIKLNLEDVNRLPFDDNTFETVACADVLEHLDNLHQMFAELIRVSSRYVIIAWPNNWVNARVPIQRGTGSFAHYGLPVARPDDRHKWFFSFTQAKEFVSAHAARSGAFSIVQERICEKPRPWPLRLIRHLCYPQKDKYLNRYAHTYWTTLQKNRALT